MQIPHFCQILLHICVFCLFPALVFGSKRCLQSESDGTDMLLLCVIYACFSSSFEFLDLVGFWGGVWRFIRIQFLAYNINNNTLYLFVLLGLMLLSAFIVLHSLSARRRADAQGSCGSLQTAAAGFLYFGVLGGKDEYKEESNVRGSG